MSEKKKLWTVVFTKKGEIIDVIDQSKPVCNGYPEPCGMCRNCLVQAMDEITERELITIQDVNDFELDELLFNGRRTMKKDDFKRCEHGNIHALCSICVRDIQIRTLEGKVAALEERINELRADHDEERRKMAWQLVLEVTRSGVNPAHEWPAVDAWEVVDTFLAAEKFDNLCQSESDPEQEWVISPNAEEVLDALEKQRIRQDSIEAVKARIEEFKKAEA